MTKAETLTDKCNVSETVSSSIIEVDIDIDSYTTTATSEKNTIEPVDNVDNLNYVTFFNNNMGHLITGYELETIQGFVRYGMELKQSNL